jgi:hypothetical protein
MSELSLNNDHNQAPNMRTEDDPYAHLWEVSPEEQEEDERRAAAAPIVGSLATHEEADYTHLWQSSDEDERHIEPRGLTERQRRVFAPFTEVQNVSKPEDQQHLFDPTYEAPRVEAPVQDVKKGRWEVTAESTEASIRKVAAATRMDSQLREIIDVYRENHGGVELTDIPDVLRTDEELRTEAAEYLLGKLEVHADSMPDRVRYALPDRYKKPTIAGYGEPMTSPEYVVALALAKLDGTFKPGLENSDPIDRDGTQVIRGQHRAAADDLLTRL